MESRGQSAAEAHPRRRKKRNKPGWVVSRMEGYYCSFLPTRVASKRSVFRFYCALIDRISRLRSRTGEERKATPPLRAFPALFSLLSSVRWQIGRGISFHRMRDRPVPERKESFPRKNAIFGPREDKECHPHAKLDTQMKFNMATQKSSFFLVQAPIRHCNSDAEMQLARGRLQPGLYETDS